MRTAGKEPFYGIPQYLVTPDWDKANPDSLYGLKYLYYDGFRMTSVYYDDVWWDQLKGARVLRARCRSDGYGVAGETKRANIVHDAPLSNCNCGIHAFFRERLSHNPAWGRGNGYGHVIKVLIEGWGKCELHESGWRSEYARLVAVLKYWPKDQMGYNSIVGIDLDLETLMKALDLVLKTRRYIVFKTEVRDESHNGHSKNNEIDV